MFSPFSKKKKVSGNQQHTDELNAKSSSAFFQEIAQKRREALLIDAKLGVREAVERIKEGIMYLQVIIVILMIIYFATPYNTASASLRQEHPRLIVVDNDFIALKSKIKTDINARKWYASIKNDAQKMMNEPTVKYELPDGVRLLPISRKVLLRVETLALAYKIEGDRQYLDRLWLELQAVAGFPDWHPVHFLDTAEMTNAFGLAYDWLYQDWSDEQKSIIRNAIIEKGLTPALDLYRGKTKGGWWITSKNNWNLVCNSGISIGALAVADEVPNIADEILGKSVSGMPKALASYDPEGAWYEGVGYWDYATSYMTYFLSSSETALGTDFGFLQQKSFGQNPYFPMYLSGQGNDSFNFGDAPSRRISSPTMFWLGNKFNKPEFSGWRRDEINRGVKPEPFDLIWYSPEKCLTPSEVKLPTDKYYKKVEVAVMRSGWNDREGIFIGCKGFNNDDRNHTDLDNGTFLLEANGVLWAEDLGADNYNLPGYFSVENGQRWLYYRKRAEGHNTMVINPGAGPDQNAQAHVPITFFQSDTDGAVATLDLTKAYNEYATSIQREVTLFDKRTKVAVKDEVHLKKNGDIWWFMHTRADIRIAKDGRTATLLRQGKTMNVSLVSLNKNIKFEVAEAKPLPTSPNPSGQNDNKDFRKLVIHATACKDFTVTVVFNPY